MKAPIGRVARFVSRQVWAIEEEKLDDIVEVLQMRAAGIALSKEEVQARIGAGEAPTLSRRAGVAVLPLYGVIAPKMTMMTEVSGGTSLDQWVATFRALRDDPGVSAIVCDLDTPGGSSYMLPEVSAEIFSARGIKPMVAVVNPECGSAGLWLAAAFEELVCTPSGMVGSVGCFVVHKDLSVANEQMGVKPTYISYGPHKVEGNRDEPLSDEARAWLQSRVDTIGGEFERTLAKFRGVSVTHVREQFGGGRMLPAKDAKAARLIDRIATLDETIARLAGRKARSVGGVGAVLSEADIADGQTEGGPESTAKPPSPSADAELEATDAAPDATAEPIPHALSPTAREALRHRVDIEEHS